MRLLLDSTVLIDALRGLSATERLRSHRRAGDRFYTTAVNVEEIVRGLRLGEIGGARNLFTSLRIVPLGLEEGWRAGEWRLEYAQRGITLSQSDALTAAAALVSEARLVTGNPRHFPMEEIAVEHWPAGQ